MSIYDAVTLVIVGVVGIAFGTYLIRKSIRADFIKVLKERWSQE